MDLVSAEYGWTDERILGCTLARLRQIVAAIQRRQWLADVAHRRLETAKLRTMCTYIAATMQLAEGADNVMLDAAQDLNLGTGTESLRDTTTPAAAPVVGVSGPAARIPVGNLADGPVSVRPGQPAPQPVGVRPLPLEKLGALLTGGGL